MTHKKISKVEKQAELKKYRDLVLATIDYELGNKELHFDSIEHYKSLQTQTEEHFQKGRLTILKQWFRDLTEGFVEEGDLNFNKYLQDKTKYDIDIFKSYYQRIEKVIEKGKITTDNQFYDINTMVDQLCQAEPVDNKKIEVLNKLLADYEYRISRQTRKPTI
jgi:hypothetical protein